MKALIKNNFLTSIFICLLTVISLFSLVSCNDTKEPLKDYDMSGITFEDKTVTYDGNEHELNISGTLPEGVTVTYENNENVNAGTYEVTAILKGNGYNTLTLKATLTINKASYDMSGITFEDKTVAYDGNEHELNISGTLPEGVTVGYTNNKLTEVGSINVIAVFSHNNPNYNDIPNMSATLTVEENPLYHTVKFIISDNEFKEVLVKEGEGVKLEDIPNIPSKTGYNGVWDKDISCITQDIEVYVKYIPNEYTITYVPNGGEIESLTQKVVYDQAFTLYEITRKGHTFLGYTYNDNMFESGIWNIDKDITLEAKWETNTYRISYMLNNEVIYYEDVLYGDNYKLYEYTNEKYKVVFWINNGNESSPNAQKTLVEDHDIVYTAKIAYVSDDFNYSISNNKATITDYKGNDLSVIIPDYIKDNKIYYQVTSIGDRAFEGCSSLDSITIPEEIMSIGDFAFYNCSSLKSVYITSIESWLSIDFGEYSSNPLCNGANLYLNNELVTDLVIPEGITSIKNYTFEGCTSLTSVTIPNSVTSIGNDAFENCSSLKSVYITSIEVWLSIDFGDEYSNPLCNGANLYLNNELVTDLVIPEGVTSIKDYAFEGCSSLTSITIPNSVILIGEYAFYNCSSLEGVYITNIEAWLSIEFDDYYSNPLNYARNLYLNNELVTDLVIPEGVTIIKDYAFSGCSSLTSVTILEGVTIIGSFAFRDCSSLKSVYITSIESWLSIDFDYYSSNPLCNGANLYLNNELVTDLVIPEGVTSIKDYAFEGCSSLTSITIPNSVILIGEYAFYNCSSLKSVYITNIEVWASIKFDGYSSNPLCNGANLYLNNELVTDLVLPEGVTSIKDYAFEGCSSLESVTIPEGVTSIGNSAFSGCSGLKSITIPEGVTSIGDRAFLSCSSLESITIPNSVTSIRDLVFAGCSSLKSITIPNSVTSIGKYAFYLCSSLKSVYITNIEAWLSIDFGEYSSNPLCNGANLYLNNELVTDLVIPEGITSIGNSAFSGCSSLESITIPEEITSIGDFAFEGCSKLNYIYYKGTADEWDNIDGSSNVYYGTIYYYSETEPITSGNYWHYDEDGITPVIWNKN